eukprot:1763602-Lingulodinium_polyedra.AAC.1
MKDRGRKDRHHLLDEPGKCRFAPPLHRQSNPRTGARPRDPRPPATSRPSADASVVDVDQFDD